MANILMRINRECDKCSNYDSIGAISGLCEGCEVIRWV